MKLVALKIRPGRSKMRKHKKKLPPYRYIRSDPKSDPDPKFPEKSDPDPNKIISDPQHCPFVSFFSSVVELEHQSVQFPIPQHKFSKVFRYRTYSDKI